MRFCSFSESSAAIRFYFTQIVVFLTMFGTCAVFQARGSEMELAWDRPLLNTDGTPLSGTIGFKVCYGVESGRYTVTNDVGTLTDVTLQNLDPHTVYYISVVAYTEAGESAYSPEIVWSYDVNDNQLPDDWEQRYFGGLSEMGGGPSDDFDHDGAPNLLEYVAGTDPTDAASRPTISVDSNGVTDDLPTLNVSFQTLVATGLGYAGRSRHYALEQRSSLFDGAWQAVAGLADVAANDLPVTLAVESGATTGYYRTRIWLE